MPKEHYFVISGTLDSDGNVHWYIDTEMQINILGPDVNVFDVETGEWEDVFNHIDNDKIIFADLRDRLYSQNHFVNKNLIVDTFDDKGKAAEEFSDWVL